jgi:hypothetical protein
MIRNRVLRTVLAFIAAAALLTAAGCSMVDTGETFSEGSGSRKAALAKVPFEAVITVYQIAADTYPVGSGPHWKTEDETLIGSVVSSDWELLEGASVVMDNRTNFNLSPLYPDYGFYPAEIEGTNHSDVTMTTLTGEKLSFTANGKIEGVFPVQAGVNMRFSLTGPSDGGSVSNVNGSLEGAFTWVFYGDIPAAQGTFTLTGFYIR